MRKRGTKTWEMKINQPDSKQYMQSIFNVQVTHVMHIKSTTPFKHQKGYKKISRNKKVLYILGTS
jgi:hypothetical protein